MQLAPVSTQSNPCWNGRPLKLPIGRIYSAEEIITAASIYVEDCGIKEQNAVKAVFDYYGELPHRERASSTPTCHPARHKTSKDIFQCPICGPPIQRKKDVMKWRKVPRRQRLCEGNFDEWLDIISSVLTKLGIWNSEAKHTKVSQDQAVRFMDDDSWAVSIMLMHVNPYFLARLQISPQVYSCELLSKLARAARPFRLGDLPTELRMRVYECMVPVDRQYDEMTRHYTHTPCWEGDTRFVTRDSVIRRLATIRNLCGVSQEFRKQVSRIHYSRNSFISGDDDGQGSELVAKWAKTVGECNLRHLCDVQLTFHYHPKGFFDGFIVTLDPSGLRPKAIESVDYDFSPWDDGILERVLMKKTQRREKTGDGADILDFFTTSSDALRSIFYPRCYRPFGEPEADDDKGCPWALFNERNAYSVAYGECYRDCPW